MVKKKPKRCVICERTKNITQNKNKQWLCPECKTNWPDHPN